jgi:steroid delta-isomerase-like uncharacterized protein
MFNRRLITVLALILLTLSACQGQSVPIEPTKPADMTEENMAVVRRFYEEFSKGNADVILEVHSPTLLMHYAGEAEEVPAQALRDDLAAIKAANPDLHAEIKGMFAQGDIVVTELTWTATHTGDFFGIPATGKTVLHNGIVVRRLEAGKIVESWEMWDDLAFLNSIGYLPSWDEIVSNPPTQSTAEQAPQEMPVTGSEGLVGAYRVKLPNKGDLGISAGYYRVTFYEDNRYTIDWAPQQSQDGMVGVNGHYTLNEDQIVLTDDSGFAACTPEQGAMGSYQWSLSGANLTLTPLEDTCEGRVYVLSSKAFPRDR